MAAAEPAPQANAVQQEMKTLGRHSAHYLAGLVASLAIGLISFPILTRVFPIAEYGLIDLALKVLLILTAFSKLGLQNAALRFYDTRLARESREWARGYYSTIFFGALGTSCLVSALFLSTVWLAARITGDRSLLSIFTVLSLLVLLRGLGSILYAFLRVEERTKTFTFFTVGTKALTICAVLTLLPWAGTKAHIYFTGVALVEVAMVGGLVFWLFSRRLLVLSSFDSALFKSGVAFGLPLVVYESAFNVLGSADRFLVRHFLGDEALGIYSVGYGLAQTVSDLLMTPLNLALMPIYVRLWSTAGKEVTQGFLNTSLRYYWLGAAGLLAVSVATANEAVVLLASEKYHDAGPLIPVLLAGLLFYTAHVFLAAGLMLHKQTIKMAAILIVAALINIVLNAVLLPLFGLMGGAAATLLSYMVCVAGLGSASSKLLPLSLGVAPIARYAMAGAAAWLAASMVHVDGKLAGFAAKSLAAAAVYCGILMLIDHEMKTAVRAGIEKLRGARS